MPRPFACMPNPHPKPDPDQADMGGMGFIQSNHSRILFNSTMISFNVRRDGRRGSGAAAGDAAALG